MFIGHLLMLATGAAYIAWWAVSFRPNKAGGAVSGLLLGAAVLAGLAAIVVISLGIYSLPRTEKGIPIWSILLGAFAAFFILLAVTKGVLHRPLTAELPLIIALAALELSAIAALHGSGRFGTGRTLTLVGLVAAATVAGLICYVLYYRLDEDWRYWTGFIPLVADSMVVAVFLPVLALS
jgi:hypothetical protein